jgi:hypothetical protein
VSDKKQLQLDKENDLVRPGKSVGLDKVQDEPKYPTAADQGFVFYEE